MPDNDQTYSIALRLRRITVEDAYVAVPVTESIMIRKDDGTYGIDFDAFTKEAIRISNDPRAEWKIESSTIEPHPTQGPKPEDRKCFDEIVAYK